MASSTSISTNPHHSLPICRHRGRTIDQSVTPNRIRCSITGQKSQYRAISSVSSSASPLDPSAVRGRSDFPEALDGWIHDSATEIVRNLREEASLLVQVYANKEGKAARLETAEAVAEDWASLARSWKEGGGNRAAPDGLILVEDLGAGEDQGTRAWGVVVQGKGRCPPACYLLKTSKVRSGLGMCCTHFCLMKVKGFRESALSQLTNCWLLD